jgi:hypothetical protein
MQDIFFGDASIEVKIRAFNCYVGSVFLYNCETWTLTKSTEKAIDSFHRKMLRIACLNVKWPRIVSNETVYEVTNQKPWSQVVMKRELSWLGHLFRLPDDTPAKTALHCSLKPSKKPRGRQRLTWVNMMKERLRGIGLEWEAASRVAMDRLAWNNTIERFCSMW